MPTAMAAPHPIPCDTLLHELKTALRQAALARRAGCDPALGVCVAGHVLERAAPPAGAVCALVWPLPGELDTRPLIQALHGRGHAIVLPQTPPRGQPLTFRRWQPGAAMVPGRFGTHHPDGAVLTPDWLAVPLLAFDAAGRRLGYGAGYYDRTLAILPAARTVGLAFAAQQVAEVPTGPDDMPLPVIVTENGLLRAES